MQYITQSNNTYTALFNIHLGTVCKISMNCVSCVVIIVYILELTLKTQVSNTMNTVGISSNDKCLLLLLLQLMFKVSISTHAGSQTSTPLIHCRTDDVAIQIAPLLYQSLHEVVDVTSIRMC